MAAEEKLLVVVGIHEGRGFPIKPGHDLMIEVGFAGETLQSDPVDHSNGSHIDINNELAWEMTRKALQEHKLQRTPIKLTCFCVNRITQRKSECGNVLLDLRSVQHQLQPTTSQWYSLLRSQYTGKRPELRISLTAETDIATVTTAATDQQEHSETSSLSSPTPPTSLPPLMLDEGNGWYLLGTPNPHQILYTISLTLSQPHNLNCFIASKGPYYFKYNILGNEIVTEEFTSLIDPCDFQAERASVRVKATPTLIQKLLLSQPDIQVNLMTRLGKVLSSGSVPIKPLAHNQFFSVSCSLSSVGGATTPTVNVTLAVQQQKGSNETEATTVKDATPSESSSSSPSPSPPPPPVPPVPPPVSLASDRLTSAKRNLAQSFEDASNSSNASVPPTSGPSPKTTLATSVTPPQKPHSPTITTPTVSISPRITFTSPKTSPLLLSHTSSSPPEKRRNKPTASPLPPKQQQTSPSTVVSSTGYTGGTVVFSQPTSRPLAGGALPPTSRPLVGGASSHPPGGVSMSSTLHQQQQLEYHTAMELEIWKMTQEEIFKKELKAKEDAHLKLLAEEFQKRDKHREDLMKQKMEHYQSLEAQLAKTLKELENQRHKLKSREHEMTSTQRRLDDERRTVHFDIEREKSLLQTELEGNLKIEKLKGKELTQQLERAKRQISDLENRLSQKEAEFESYKGHTHTHNESRLQAELGLMKLEKNELEHKLDSVTKSKQHYKDQWTKALKEIASLKHREQSVLRDQLKKQQLELETMRDKYLQAEEQDTLQKQLQQIKEETHRLRAQTLAPPTAPPTHTLAPSTHRLPTPSPPRVQNLDANIARWIEERNILLQTGVYTHADSTIQKLDKKIQEALLEKKSHDLSS